MCTRGREMLQRAGERAERKPPFLREEILICRVHLSCLAAYYHHNRTEFCGAVHQADGPSGGLHTNSPAQLAHE